MNAYLLILPLALVLSGVFLWLFLRAVRKGQFEDLEDPPRRVLRD